jgi:hypothetical protein
MTPRLLAPCLALVLTVLACADARAMGGTWKATLKEDSSGRIQFMLDTDDDGNMGMGIQLEEFYGLTMDQIRSATPMAAHFEMRREAGTIAYDGVFRDGVGAGKFGFTPNRDYAKGLRQLGVEFAPEEVEDRHLFSLAMFDVSTEFIAAMRKIGYREDLQTYVQFRIFKVDPAFVRAMDAVGFENLTAQKLIETRIHNVTPDYISQMRASGNDLTLDEYIQSRIFAVTPEFAREMDRAGYPDLDHDTLVQFKIHGVSAQFVKEIKSLGYAKVPADELVAMRIHGVTPEFIRRVDRAGYHKVPVEKLIQMRIFNIDPEMVEALDEGRR